MQNPHNLRVYGEAKKLVVQAYRLTATFPREERYGAIAQVRSAAWSVGANIAEGCGRGGNRALCAFLHNSMGSLSELEFHLEMSVALTFCDGAPAEAFLAQLNRTKAMMAALIVKLRGRPDGPTQ